MATVVGLLAGWLDLLHVSWVLTALLVLFGGAALGHFFERHPRSLAFSLGFGPFLLQLLALMFDWMPAFKQNLFFSLLALIPAFIGVYAGRLSIKLKK
ncbi:MAG: hypothetical protein KJ620_01240 [Candidatus Edwardsbacteria bacterium]|nr:hypothetical protein [Candidatus Edwardsbacteria bacterium]MBU1577001.1 hypothetical protein [Candidatus Edwardsbacteria bacterium]MBU2464123.1 hypothetical protein [Candidatus Edwardsbacteria bacterium]MBU2594822.1 hypothetical protein [Candidatus Edwardsbacteria bacterium]